jgi:transcriptional antiterminator RfaH
MGVWFVEAMFSGYLFARFNYAACHRRIRQRPGISGFVQFGDRLALLPDSLIGKIKIRVILQQTLKCLRLSQNRY